MLTPEGLLTLLRQEDDLDDALENVVVLPGAGGPASGGACPAYVFVSSRGVVEHAARIREVAAPHFDGEVIFHFVRSNP